MAIDHGALHRMQRVVVALQTFDGEQFLPVQRWQKLDARIDRTKPHTRSVELGDDYGARATVALGASFLGSGSAQVLAQEIEHGARGIDVPDSNDFAIENEADRIGSWQLLLACCHDVCDSYLDSCEYVISSFPRRRDRRALRGDDEHNFRRSLTCVRPQALGRYALPSDAGKFRRISCRLPEISTRTTIVATYGSIDNSSDGTGIPSPCA